MTDVAERRSSREGQRPHVEDRLANVIRRDLREAYIRIAELAARASRWLHS